MTDKTPERRKATVVTSQNLAAYQAKELARLAPVDEPVKEPVKEEEKKEVVKDGEKPVAKAEEPDKEVEPKKDDEVKEEPKKEEAKKEEKDEEDDDSAESKKSKGKLSERMHELAEKAKTERLKRVESEQAYERRISELEAKLKPEPEKIDETPKPTKEQFPDPFDYAEKLSDWSVKDALRKRDEQEAKSRHDAKVAAVQESWQKRVDALKKEVPDFADKIEASSIVVSNEVRDAIMESDVGPKILLHFVENPDEAEKIGKMTVGKAYIAIGKLEAILSAPPKEPEKEPEQKPKEKVKPVEVSKAPPPITPLKGANAPADLPVVDGVWKGTHQQYREARLAGKIK